MNVIQANPGEMVYNLLVRAIAECKASRNSTVIVKHNDVEIYVYRESYISDLCDKFELAKLAQRLARYSSMDRQ